MKKIIFLLLSTITFFGCSSDDDSGCICEAKFRKNGQSGNFYVSNYPIDCNSKLPKQNPPLPQDPNAIFVGCNN